MQPLPSLAWAEVLENVEKTLAEAQTEAARSEQALGSPIAPEAAPAEPACRQALDQLEERFRQLRGCIAEAELNASQAEKSVNQGKEMLENWLAQAAVMRRKLANGTDSSV